MNKKSFKKNILYIYMAETIEINKKDVYKFLYKNYDKYLINIIENKEFLEGDEFFIIFNGVEINLNEL